MTTDISQADEATATLAVRATLRLRNHAMIERRKALGLTQKQLAQVAGCSVWFVCHIEALDWAFAKPERTEEAAGEIAASLDLPRDAILPPGALGHRVESTITRIANVEVEHLLERRDRQEQRILMANPQESFMAGERKEAVLQALSTLPYREREIVKLRFGIGDGQEHTLEEVGRIFKMTRERVRQVELKAMRRLRNPQRAAMLGNDEPR